MCICVYLCSMTVKVGVVGASGYAGAELLRLLHGHSEFDVVLATAASNAGLDIAQLHPALTALCPLTLADTAAATTADLDLVFIALPHGESAALTAALPDSVRVVDLGADHRLVSTADWDRYYGTGEAAPPWVYGLPELPGRRDEVMAATKVANPGCYATALQLSAAPLLAAGLVEPTDIVAVAASGTSGAGRKASIPHSATEVMGSMSSYKVGGVHQHTAEVCQELSEIAGTEVSLSFTPLLAPMPRGILATTTLRLLGGVSAEAVDLSVREFYADSEFVFVLSPGTSPVTSATAGTNCAHIQSFVDERSGRVVVVAAIDNLGKGAAGQAIQNANLMYGLPEATGLHVLGVAP